MSSRSKKLIHSTVRTGDNLPFMTSLPDGCCDLIYIDPPFCSNRVRATAARSRSYSDVWTGGLKSYLAFLHPRLVECHRLLASHGLFFAHLDWRAVHYVKIQLDTLFGPSNFLNEIIWHYRTGGASKRWFGRKHDTILLYARQAGRHRFNLLRHGAHRTDGLNYDSAGRPFKSTRRGRLYFHPGGPALTDVWDLPFLSTVSNERCGWPTQKPLKLLDRVIRAASRPGDLVADFFCGSGTTLVAAKQLGRRWLGCDASSQAVRIARRRLAKTAPRSALD